AGRLEADSLWDYTWNGMGRLVSMQRKSGTSPDPELTSETIAFVYDADGHRTLKTRTRTYEDAPDRVETSKLYWSDWLPVCEEISVDSGTASRRWFVWGQDVSGSWDGAGGIGGLLAIQEEGGRTLLPVHDGLGNITALIHAGNGDTVATYDYAPFGEIIAESGEVDACPFRYQSKFYDGETGLSYFGFRYYSAKLGRWISRDPLGESGGFNLYGYCGNDPVNGRDYLGMWDVVKGSLRIDPVPTNVGVIFRASVEIAREWSTPGPVASGMYNPSWTPNVHRQTVRIPVNQGIHLRSLLAKGGGPMAQYWAEQVFLGSAQNIVDGLHGEEVVDGITTANDVLSILPGWQVGESMVDGKWWAAPLFLGRDVLLWGTGTKFIQAGATIPAKVGRGALVGMGQGFTAATIDIGVDRASAGLGGYAYAGSWRSDGTRVLMSTAFGGFGGGVAGRFVRVAETSTMPITLIQQRELARLATSARNELVNDFDKLLSELTPSQIASIAEEPWRMQLFFGTAVETRVARNVAEIVKRDPKSVLTGLRWTGRTNAPQDFIGPGGFGFDITGGSWSSIWSHQRRAAVDAVVTYDSIPSDLGYKFIKWLE
uniref:RHS repeat-associated core domain-containing protein n=1 Tax=Verrucomicrobium sp. BvORR034 TaxID=1396418 RepID=UPI0022410135